ncbi:MAG: peptidoglycan DD-metalloendopeptidase family protein [Alphaproteobacteria bacterium]|nr:peptidoglycan DD-metalloendopeptidase family protein [Alphaproteobacteria bacterium]
MTVVVLKAVIALLVIMSRLEKSLMQHMASFKDKLALHRFIKLRRRYIYTKSNKLRARYVVGCASIAILAFTVSLGAMISLKDLSVNDLQLASYNTPFDQGGAEKIADANDSSFNAPDPRLAGFLQSGISSGMRKASAAIQKSEKPRFREVELGKGDTVAGLLQNAGLSGSDTYHAVRALGKYLDVRKVKSGQKIDLHFRPGDAGELQLARMDMKLDPVREVRIVRKGPEAFEAEIEEKALVPRTHARKAKIQSSLYGSAARASIPSTIVEELIRVYSWNIDFQRDIQPGDTLEVLYETLETEDGDYARNGNILYASLSVGGKKIPIYRYEMQDGRTDYFGPDGSSIRKTLMKTPIDGARISSGFGMRKHPVLGYSKMHKGMDFAAPTGTPIYAAGDGTVEYASRFSSYGNYIRIRHNSKLKTAYAHLHKIRSGVTVGSRVKQGQIIGYVGTTGRSTGPHLHYEVMVNNAAVNPTSVTLPTGEQLRGGDLDRLKARVNSIRQQYVSLVQNTKLAQNTIGTDEGAQGETQSRTNIH